jgi:photosystem II stability/assembly factor-like uncharacterized protein
MKTLYFLTSCFILSTFSANAQWIDLEPSPQKQIRQLIFTSAQNGYAIQDDSGTAKTKFYKTENAGASFEHIPWSDGIFNTAGIHGMHFVTNDVGFLAFRAFTPSLDAKIYKTSNGGLQWSDVSPTNLVVGSGWMDVYFINTDTGFALSGGTFYKTTNGGQAWSSDVLLLQGELTRFKFNSSGYGIMGGWDGTFLYKGFVFTTTDFGNTWDTLALHDVQSNVEQVDITSDTTFFAISSKHAGADRALLRSTTNGQSWDSLDIAVLKDSMDQIGDFVFLSGKNGYFCTYKGYIYETMDSGQSWTLEHKDFPSLNVLTFYGASVYCAGPVNTLLRKSLFNSIQHQATEENILIYPNPAEQYVQIEIPKGSWEIRVYDLNGKQMLIDKGFHESNRIDVSQWNDGLYIVECWNSDQKISTHFIKSSD